MPKIVLTTPKGARALYYGDEALTGLRALGEVRLNDNEVPWTTAELAREARAADIIVSDRSTPGPGALFDALPDLVAIVRCAIDIRNIDVAAASRHGILVTQASRGFVASVAEMILGYMVDLARHITSSTAAYHAGRVPPALVGRQLNGSVLGVIGYGAIGQYLVDLGVALGMTVLVSDPHAAVTRPDVARVDLPDLLARADFVICLAVATEATENLMDAAAFARMKPTAYFINASRGNLVDEAALAVALISGRIAGAALDVGRAPDQMPTPRLAALPNVLATPHTGGLTPPATAHQALETVRQVAEIIQGRAPPGAVNAAEATRLARFRKSG
jgi:D-3-phosphoglycerate dehydrogenase